MVSAAQIAYPVHDEEDEPIEEDTPEDEVAESPDEETREIEDGIIEEDLFEDDDGYMEKTSGRRFDVSPEDFCADPYCQQGHRESRQELGRKGEDAAVRFLLSKGYEILKRNWFCKFGEADIIARDVDGTLCFIEVKTRKSIEAGIPEEAITPDKRRRYERIALCYMMVAEDWEDNDSVRFDAICICVTGPHRAMLRHHRSCFDASF